MKWIFTFLLLLTNSITALGQTATEKLLTQNDAEDRYASYSPDGAQILFESNRDGNWEIYLMDADGENQLRITNHEAEDRRPSWHPQGKKIVFESNRSGKFQLYELCLKSRKTKALKIPTLEGEPVFVRYSPNGKKLAFSLKKSSENAHIVIANRRGKTLKVLADNGFRSFYPNWSPDGKSLVFFSRHQTNNEDDEIYTIQIDGSNLKRLTNWNKHNFCPTWSPDGKKIAYVTSMEGSRPEIYIMDADGKNQTRITFNEDGDTLPSWSADGQKLLITGYRDGNYEICELTF